MKPISDFDLQVELPRSRRFRLRGVPVVELWVSGPDHVFQRVAGILDSGASRTFLARPTYERLGFKKDDKGLRPSNALTGQILYKPQVVHVRIPIVSRPSIHVLVRAGLTDDIEENVFGVDLSEYFAFFVAPDRVMLLGDERESA